MNTLNKQALNTLMFDSEKIEKIAHCARAKATQELIQSLKNLFQSQATLLPPQND
jgi:predicted DNA-binding transcriptional regulator YafY